MEDFGSSEAGKKGGKARASKLTPKQRSEIASRAAEARWKKAGKSKCPRATHGSEDRPLKIGDMEIPCYVLDDKRRVIVQRGMMTSLDISQGTAGRGGGDRLARFINTKSIRPYVSNELGVVIKNPIKFNTPAGGGVAYGYEATVLADLCDAVLDARKRGKLNYQQEHIADQCEMLVRSFAKLGIIALVDEVTGYQYDRARTALEELLEEFLSAELRAWVKTFPNAYFKQLCRLKNIPFRGDMRFPRYFGRITANIVYKRLAPGVLAALQIRSPADAKGNRPSKLFQWLSDDVGHPKLLQHLGAVVGLMKISPDYETFKMRLDTVAPVQPNDPSQIRLPFDEMD